jgi:hypothetical protein
MALNYLICLLDVIGRLATRNADNLLLRLMYGRRTAQASALTDAGTFGFVARTSYSATAVPAKDSHCPKLAHISHPPCDLGPTWCHPQDAAIHIIPIQSNASQVAAR